MRKLFKMVPKKLINVIPAVLLILSMGARVALGDTPPAVDVKPIDPTGVKQIVNLGYYIMSGIGGGILMLVGQYHALHLSAAARNGNKRAIAIESIGVTLASVFIFFAFPWLAGMLRGAANQVNAGN